MPQSDFVFERDDAVLVGDAGEHDFVLAAGEHVTDRGESNFVFEAGVGISGAGGFLIYQKGDDTSFDGYTEFSDDIQNAIDAAGQVVKSSNQSLDTALQEQAPELLATVHEQADDLSFTSSELNELSDWWQNVGEGLIIVAEHGDNSAANGGRAASGNQIASNTIGADVFEETDNDNSAQPVSSDGDCDTVNFAHPIFDRDHTIGRGDTEAPTLSNGDWSEVGTTFAEYDDGNRRAWAAGSYVPFTDTNYFNCADTPRFVARVADWVEYNIDA